VVMTVRDSGYGVWLAARTFGGSSEVFA
jgi:hypothetical protein